MRILAAWMLGGTLMSSVGMWPSGCSVAESVQVNPRSGQPVSAVPKPRQPSTKPSLFVSGAMPDSNEPLVPPIQLDDELERSQLLPAVDQDFAAKAPNSGSRSNSSKPMTA